MELTATAQPLEPRRLRFVAAAAAATLVAGAFAGPVGAAVAPSHLGHLDPGLSSLVSGTARVIVQAEHGAVSQAKRAVEKLRGSIWTMLPVVDGFSATVPASQLDRLVRDPSVRAVTADRAGQVLDSSVAPLTAPQPDDVDAGALAPQTYQHGDLGQGVSVAVIDTGVSPVEDLGGPNSGRLVYGPDLSGEKSLIDTYGHGTVMAGLVAGDGTDSGHRYGGVAPSARIISVKTAGRDGSVGLGQILAAMGWVGAYHQQYDIRVLNLSWGVPSTQVQGFDPLDVAVDRLWSEGILVVAAAGNGGAGNVLAPGNNPHVLTVGAYDNDTQRVASFSAYGSGSDGATAKPDLVAPGTHVVGTLSMGSTIASDPANHPALRAGADGQAEYIRGSGTSQATAITSGAAALVLAAHPDYSPQQVKQALTGAATPLAGAGAGAGLLNIDGAVASSHGSAGSQFRPAAAKRDSSGQSNGVGCALGQGARSSGERGGQNLSCSLAQWLGSMWTGSMWTGSMWTGSMWTGSMWTGSMWTGGDWTGSMWTGSMWTGSMWTGSMWTGSMWTGSMWTGSMWTGSMWTGSMWTGSMWTGSMWTGSMWTSQSYG